MTKTRKQRDMAIRIAKDALKWLRFATPGKGSYFYIPYLCRQDLGIRKGDSAQKHLKTLAKNCQVCALGAMFLGHISARNKVSVGDVYKGDGEEIIKKLGDVFSYAELKSIEVYFEGWNTPTPLTQLDIEPFQFYINNLDDRKRLRMLLHNIIKNDGVFDPSKLPRKKAKE